MELLEHREQLKEAINNVQREPGERMRAGWTIEEHQPLLKRVSTLHDQLARTYCSRLRWWLRQMRSGVAGLYYRIWPSDLEQTIRPLGSFECTSLLASLAPQIAASNAEVIQITEDNITRWLGRKTTSMPGFDPASCMDVLRKSTRHGFTRYGGKGCSFFMDCPNGEHIQVSGIVRWPWKGDADTRE